MGRKDDVDELKDKLDDALKNGDMDLFRHLLGEEDEESDDNDDEP